MNICENFVLNARLFPDRDALRFEGAIYSYSELDRLTQLAANVLLENGIEKGDRVGILATNVPAFMVWYNGALKIGAIAVSINTRLTAEEVVFILNDCETKILVGLEELLEGIQQSDAKSLQKILTVSEDGFSLEGSPLDSQVESTPSSYIEMHPDDPATILYTSGTTGFPKGATLSHMNVRSSMHCHNHLCEMVGDDRILLAVPLFHCYGQNSLMNAGFQIGATIVLQRRFDLNESKQLIIDHQVTKLFGVPTMFQLMVDSCSVEDLSSVGYCFSAAATLPSQLTHRWIEKFGMPVYEGYGLTETSPFASYNHRVHYVPGSLGTPCDLVEMKVVDPETGELCESGVPGEIAIRGPNVMLGYWNRPEETAEAVRDGWFHSGDIGQQDENGYFYIVDRVKDMIIVGGLKVYPAEVERVIYDDSNIEMAAVVGIPDDVLGEVVGAFLVYKDEGKINVQSLKDRCQQHLASFKVPSRFMVMDELPKNPAGKILKKELRKIEFQDYEFEASSSPVIHDASSNGTSENPDSGLLVRKLAELHDASRERFLLDHLIKEVKLIAELEESPQGDSMLLDLGLDSLMMVDLSNRLQQQMGPEISLPATLVFEYPRLFDLASHLLSLTKIQPAQSIACDGMKAKEIAKPKQPNQNLKTEIETMTDAEAEAELIRELNE